LTPACVFTPTESPAHYIYPPGFRAAQCGDPTRAALRCLSNSCRRHVSVPRLHRGCVRPVLCSRNGRRCRRRRLRAVPVRSLAGTHELHDPQRATATPCSSRWPQLPPQALRRLLRPSASISLSSCRQIACSKTLQ
ncbi:unnamed protein product, partial [Tetraodon nigroviridis]